MACLQKRLKKEKYSLFFVVVVEFHIETQAYEIREINILFHLFNIICHLKKQKHAYPTGFGSLKRVVQMICLCFFFFLNELLILLFNNWEKKIFEQFGETLVVTVLYHKRTLFFPHILNYSQ